MKNLQKKLVPKQKRPLQTFRKAPRPQPMVQKAPKTEQIPI